MRARQTACMGPAAAADAGPHQSPRDKGIGDLETRACTRAYSILMNTVVDLVQSTDRTVLYTGFHVFVQVFWGRRHPSVLSGHYYNFDQLNGGDH